MGYAVTVHILRLHTQKQSVTNLLNSRVSFLQSAPLNDGELFSQMASSGDCEHPRVHFQKPRGAGRGVWKGGSGERGCLACSWNCPAVLLQACQRSVCTIITVNKWAIVVRALTVGFDFRNASIWLKLWLLRNTLQRCIHFKKASTSRKAVSSKRSASHRARWGARTLPPTEGPSFRELGWFQ